MLSVAAHQSDYAKTRRRAVDCLFIGFDGTSYYRTAGGRCSTVAENDSTAPSNTPPLSLLSQQAATAQVD
jgi:hypothetical protein